MHPFGRSIGALALAVAFVFPGASRAALDFDFDDGSFQGWVVVDDGPGLTLSPTDAALGGLPGATSGTFRVAPDPFGARDGAHERILVRSPQFFLDGSGDLTADFAGGQGAGTSQATLPGSPSDLATTTGGAGTHAMGLGVRRVSDGMYVATAQRATNGASFSTITVDAATLAPFVSGTEQYTLDVYDSFAGGWGWVAFDTVSIPGTPGTPAKPNLVFDFDDGTFQGWETISSGNLAFEPTDASIGGLPPATSGDFRVAPIPFGPRDGAHEQMLVRSPEFLLHAEGDLSIDLTGGQGQGTSQAGTLPTMVSDLAADTGGADVHMMGFALRRVSDGAYLLVGQRPVNNASFATINIPQSDLLGFASNTERYTLDVFDTFAGGWGWIAFDTVIIPGTIPPVPEPMTPALAALASLALLRRRCNKG